MRLLLVAGEQPCLNHRAKNRRVVQRVLALDLPTGNPLQGCIHKACTMEAREPVRPNALFAMLLKRHNFRIVVVGLGVTIFLTMLSLAYPGKLHHDRNFSDYGVFALTGNLALQGRVTEAYDVKAYFHAQKTILHAKLFSPWAYPPVFDLIVMILALFPKWLGYLIWASSGLCAFLLALRKLAPGGSQVALIAVAPAALVCLADGQTGLIVAALAALVALNWDRSPCTAGIFLGLMIIKPQFALGFGALALIRRDWKIVMYALGTAGVLAGIATIVLGGAVWSAFFHGAADAMTFLTAGNGFYPLYRMISAYAALRSMGASSDAAFAGQFALAITCLAFLLIGNLRGQPLHELTALAVFAGICITPYAFDYDLPLVAVSYALLTRELAKSEGVVTGAIVILTWAAGGVGMLENLAISTSRHDSELAIALGVLPMLGAMALTFSHHARPTSAEQLGKD